MNLCDTHVAGLEVLADTPVFDRVSMTANPDTEDVPPKIRFEGPSIVETWSSGTQSRYRRASEITAYVKARADGICEACGEPAPFQTSGDDPYLEVYHVDELGEGGEDHPVKIIALCPTCHERVHYGRDGDRLDDERGEKLANGHWHRPVSSDRDVYSSRGISVRTGTRANAVRSP